VTSHLGLLLLFAACAAAVFAAIAKDSAREQLRTGLKLFAGFVAAAIGLGWLLYFIPL
jgi:heme A synthase